MSARLITSRDNPLFKQLRELANSTQARRQTGRTLLEGVHLCEVYVQQVGMPRLCIVGESAQTNPEVEAIARRCETSGAACIVLPDALYAALSQVEHGVPLLFLIDTPLAVANLPLQQSALLLDNLQDPGNLGSILRTAAASGIKAVFCSPGTANAWAPKVLRAGMGAHFALTIIENVDLGEVIAASSVPTIATCPRAQIRLYDVDLKGPVAWLFGHEGQGVRPELLAQASQQVTIPQTKSSESLNVAASVAVCLFEQMRQGLFKP